MVHFILDIYIGNYDVYVAKYSSSGDTVWVLQFGSTSFDIGSSICISSDSQSVYVAGYTLGSLVSEQANVGIANTLIVDIVC